MAGTSPAEQVAAIDRASDRIETPGGAGALVWRVWGTGAPLVLLHGAFGSWTHWIRNVEALAAHFRVIVPDMPGYGDSADAPEPCSPESLAAILAEGLDRIVPRPERLDLAGFSFGGIIAGHLAALLGERVRALVLIGPNGMRLRRGESGPLRRLERGMDEAAVRAVHRHNLGVLMIADPAKVDDLAVHLQIENARRSRTKSGAIPQSDSLLLALPRVTARLHGIWGARDAMAVPYLADRERLLRALRPEIDFRIVPDAGHWVPFEAPAAVNRLLVEMSTGNMEG